ncbi:MAG: metal-dependent transcriptional regulator [Calditrichaeota bacterium]|nr:MAG: metal-dependent transcriptional regulator [Calditrichota bacterium]MBL1207017.1 metal-dependent transcriptional regulator [Calditrichota bacterium]NOG46844.1 metal-dependent transcriptional regulator [Calditrichota bacterium]
MKITRSQEDYLKIIWHLQQQTIKANAKLVADKLSVKPPTVLSMFRQLEKCNLITYNKSDGALLSVKGEEIARKLVRKHRLVETFLETVLEMDDQHIHEEAEKLEHVISDQLMYRIDAYLGFPDKDPHGSPIPSWDKVVQHIKLNEVKLNESFTIHQNDFTSVEKKYYKKPGLVPGSIWTLDEIPPGKGCYLLANGKKFLAIPEATAQKILVTIRK